MGRLAHLWVPMTAAEFAAIAQQKTEVLQHQALLVMYVMGPQKFYEDHVLCAECRDKDPKHCDAARACFELVQIAKQEGHPEWAQ